MHLLLLSLFFSPNIFACENPISLKLFKEDPDKFRKMTPVKLDKDCIPYAISRSALNQRYQGQSSLLMQIYKKQIRHAITQHHVHNFKLSPIEQISDNPSLLVKGDLLNNVTDIDNKKLFTANLAQTAWSDWYWPISVGQLGYRYASSKLDHYLQGVDLDDENSWPTLNTYHLETNISEESIDDISPSEKYDLLVGDSAFSLTKSQWRVGQLYQESEGEVQSWMGICHGWAAAAFMLPRPTKSITLLSRNKEHELKFRPADLKALGSLLYANGRFKNNFVGTRCNIKDPEVDENNRVKDPKCLDSNPGTWHQVIVSLLGHAKETFVMDATYDAEVWNHPVRGYHFNYFNPQTLKVGQSLKESLIKVDDFKEDIFKELRSKDAYYLLGIEMEVSYLVETMPQMRDYDSSDFDALSYVTYSYDLELDKDFNIIGGEWYQLKHPDFLWAPAKETRVFSDLDHYIPQDMSFDDLIYESNLNELVKHSSSKGQPIARIVEELFERSSKQE